MKKGDKVIIQETGVIGEVVELHEQADKLVAKIKIAGSDGKYTFEEVEAVALEVVLLVRQIRISQLWGLISQAFKNIFKPKQKA